MAKTKVRPPRAARWLRGALAVLTLAALAWTGLWFAAASWVESEFDARTVQLAREGRADIECGHREVTGFPFALNFACDEDVVVDTERAEIAFAGLEAGASAFSPGTWRAALAGPANVVLAPGMMAMADWRSAELTLADAFGARRAELSFLDLALDLPRVDVAAERGRLVLAPDGFDLDIALDAGGLTIVPSGRPAAAVARLSADATLERLHHRLLVRMRPFDPADGLKGTMQRLALETGGETASEAGGATGATSGSGGRLLVSGPFEISPDGRVSGRFTIAIRNGAAIAAVAARLVDGTAEIEGALTALETLGERRTIDGVEMRAIELEAVDGRMPLGFVSIDLPRVWGG